jgi:hypothetical protein
LFLNIFDDLEKLQKQWKIVFLNFKSQLKHHKICHLSGVAQRERKRHKNSWNRFKVTFATWAMRQKRKIHKLRRWGIALCILQVSSWKSRALSWFSECKHELNYHMHIDFLGHQFYATHQFMNKSTGEKNKQT